MEGEYKELYPGWQTVRKIGSGSFGSVYEIERDLFGKAERAALKLISIPQSESDVDELYSSGYDYASISAHFENLLADIVQEYSLMAEMKGHTSIVYCDDLRYIQHEDGIGWDIFIKMELLTPLAKLPIPSDIERQAVLLGRDLCDALVLCRSRSIIHRDIKPQNIFVSQDGNYKLGDFGIARTMEKTSSGTKIGTYNYMAPEVYNNQPYGHPADIYSLGLVLYWLLNERRLPFCPMPPQVPKNADLEYARSRRFGGEAIPAPLHGSPALKQIVLKACAFDPKDRYQTAEDMLSALEALDSGKDILPTPQVEPEPETEDPTVGIFSIPAQKSEPILQPEPEPTLQSEQESAMTPTPKKKGTLFAIIGALAAVIGFLILLVPKGGTKTTANVPTEPPAQTTAATESPNPTVTPAPTVTEAPYKQSDNLASNGLTFVTNEDSGIVSADYALVYNVNASDGPEVNLDGYVNGGTTGDPTPLNIVYFVTTDGVKQKMYAYADSTSRRGGLPDGGEQMTVVPYTIKDGRFLVVGSAYSLGTATVTKTTAQSQIANGIDANAYTRFIRGAKNQTRKSFDVRLKTGYSAVDMKEAAVVYVADGNSALYVFTGDSIEEGLDADGTLCAGDIRVAQSAEGVLQFNLVYRDDFNNEEAWKTGTCFLINSNTIVTADHCCRLTDEDLAAMAEYYGKSVQEVYSRLRYSVTINRDVTLGAAMKQQSHEMDFAILQLETNLQDKEPLVMRHSAEVEQDEDVFAVGFPGQTTREQSANRFNSDDATITDGHVNKIMSVRTWANADFIQSSCKLTNGMSGGPMVDGGGYVIGICHGRADEGADDSYYAVCIDQLLAVCDAIGISYVLASS